MSRYPKGGFINEGQEIQVAVKADSSVVILPEMRIAKFEVTPEAIDTDAILETTTLTSCLTTIAAAALDGQPDCTRTITATGDAESEAAVVTVNGLDDLGAALTADIVLANGTEVETTVAFASITGVEIEQREHYTLDLDTPDGGTFTLGNGAALETVAIAWNASDATIQSALRTAYSNNTITYAAGQVVGPLGSVMSLQIMDDSLTYAVVGTATCTMNDLGDVIIGVGESLGIPVDATQATGFCCYLDGAAETFVHSVDATDGEVSENLLTCTNSANFDGTEAVEFYFMVAARG